MHEAVVREKKKRRRVKDRSRGRSRSRGHATRRQGKHARPARSDTLQEDKIVSTLKVQRNASLSDRGHPRSTSHRHRDQPRSSRMENPRNNRPDPEGGLPQPPDPSTMKDRRCARQAAVANGHAAGTNHEAAVAAMQGASIASPMPVPVRHAARTHHEAAVAAMPGAVVRREGQSRAMQRLPSPWWLKGPPWKT